MEQNDIVLGLLALGQLGQGLRRPE
jgi:hypothetical protein